MQAGQTLLDNTNTKGAKKASLKIIHNTSKVLFEVLNVSKPKEKRGVSEITNCQVTFEVDSDTK